MGNAGKRQILFAALGVLSICVPSSLNAESPCDFEDFTAISKIRFVHEAEVSARNYDHLAYRGKFALDAVFGERFREFVIGLPKGARVFDSGGGYSLYGIELTSNGLKVVSANAQDLYAENIYSLGDPEFIKRAIPEFMNPVQGREARLGNINGSVLNWLAAEYEIVPPKYYSLNPAIFGPKPNAASVPESVVREDFAQFIKSLQAEMEANVRFRRETGLVQDILPSIPDESQDLIIDIWGAVPYSGDRLSILEQFSRKLKMNGRAFVSLDRIDDQVILGNGERIALFKYLVKTFPRSFQFVDERESSLMILGDGPVVELSKIFEGRIVPNPDGHKNVPKLEYRLRQPR